MSYRELSQATKSLEEYQTNLNTARLVKAQAERDIEFESMRIRNAEERIRDLLPKLGFSNFIQQSPDEKTTEAVPTGAASSIQEDL